MIMVGPFVLPDHQEVRMQQLVVFPLQYGAMVEGI